MIKEKKTQILYGIGALLLVLVTMGVTYAIFTYVKQGTKENTLSTGKILFEYNETSNGIELTDAMPVSDVVGTKSMDHYFDFHVKAEITAETTISYTVYGVDITEGVNKLEGQYVKIYLTNQSDEAKAGYIDKIPTFESLTDVQGPKNVKGKKLYQDQFSASGTHDYRIRMWVDDSYVVTGTPKTFKMRVDVSTDVKETVNAVKTLLKNYTNVENEVFDTNNLENPKNKNLFIEHRQAGDKQQDWNEDELTEYRYIGSTPNNYVTFNEEEAGWRIIGIFTVEDENGKKEKRIKLIHHDAIESNPWDLYNQNDWHKSTLMQRIKLEAENESYTWTDEGKKMIKDAKWYLGGLGETLSVNTMYLQERGNDVYISDNSSEWIGAVGLMYPSDYGFATSGGSTTNREICLTTEETYEWPSDCANNDWLFKQGDEWALSPTSINGTCAFSIYGMDGSMICSNTGENFNIVRPTIYLKADVQYFKGTGSKEDPFIFSE